MTVFPPFDLAVNCPPALSGIRIAVSKNWLATGALTCGYPVAEPPVGYKLSEVAAALHVIEIATQTARAPDGIPPTPVQVWSRVAPLLTVGFVVKWYGVMKYVIPPACSAFSTPSRNVLLIPGAPP